MPQPVFTDVEKSRIRHHTGYPEVMAAASIQYGLPKPAQLAFMIELAMDNIMPVAAPRVRDILQALDDLEQQMIDAQPYLIADKLEELTLAGSGGSQSLVTERLENEYRRWAGRLADIFGVPLYPFSKRFASGAGQKAGNIPVR